MTLENGNLESLEARFLVGLDCSGRTWSLQVVTHTVVLWPVFFFWEIRSKYWTKKFLALDALSIVLEKKDVDVDYPTMWVQRLRHLVGIQFQVVDLLGWKPLRFLNDVNNTFHLEVTLHIPKNKVYTQAFQMMWPHYKSFKGSDCHAKNMRCLL